MIIKSKFKDYQVNIENDLDFLKNFETGTQFVIDEKVYNLYQDYFANIAKENIILIKATEENKVIETVLNICQILVQKPEKRNIKFVSIGGGIIQDITGFVANVLYRGIKWSFVPTTLLASCDSCIGGKTSINYKSYKNLLGTFYPPDQIFICPKFFNTLTDRDFKSGLGEVVKFNIMNLTLKKDVLNNLNKDVDKLLNRDKDLIKIYVEKSLNYKKGFIEKDEFDKGERIKLNFAHTFGHAIETVSNYEIPHGTAVAIGMIMANKVSVLRHMLNEEFAKLIDEILLKIIDIKFSLKNCVDQIVAAMKKDKKQINNALTAVLINESNGEIELKIVNDLQIKEIEMAIDHFVQIYEYR